MPTRRADAPSTHPLRLPERRRLGTRQRLRLALEILAAYAAARRALHREPIETALARARASNDGPDRGESSAASFAEACRLGVAVARTLALAPGDTRCLVRSLVLSRLLARRGIPSTLVIGARSAPRFLAHAWVEYAGRAVLDPGDGSFARLVEL